MSDLKSIKQRFGIIGNSDAYNNALKIAMRVAPTNLTVLITGESGAGKEVFSQIIHALSPRKHNAFIAVNSGAIPEGTIDSELFGHEKGAFTGASDKRKGYFETADKGTLFLDEVGEIPLGTQARLLRVLETGEFIKVGSSKVFKTDVRLIAATNKDLFDDINNGKFREDLYYRLGTVPIKVPPLRDRPEDISLLFRKFAADFSNKYRTDGVKLDKEAQQLLVSYHWPGNVRELKNIAEQVSVLSTDRIITKDVLIGFLPKTRISHLPALIGNGQSNGGDSYSERELLYKIMFDMKNDITDLKKILYQIVQSGPNNAEQNELAREFALQYANENKNETAFADGSSVHFNTSANHKHTKHPQHPHSQHSQHSQHPQHPQHPNNPMIIRKPEVQQHEEVEESLSIDDKEQELIRKALAKHKGKRKDAALDLGISERTLYRKIKEYKIDE